MGVCPTAAMPTAKPRMPCSDSGVLKTRSAPYRSRRSTLQRKTPPKATSSPKTQAFGSVARATDMASFRAVKRFIFFVSKPVDRLEEREEGAAGARQAEGEEGTALLLTDRRAGDRRESGGSEHGREERPK